MGVKSGLFGTPTLHINFGNDASTALAAVFFIGKVGARSNWFTKDFKGRTPTTLRNFTLTEFGVHILGDFSGAPKSTVAFVTHRSTWENRAKVVIWADFLLF